MCRLNETWKPALGANDVKGTGYAMNNTLLIVLAVIAIILILVGVLNVSLNTLLWIGLILLIVAVVLYFVRGRGGRRV